MDTESAKSAERTESSNPATPDAVPHSTYYVYRDRHSDGTVGFFTIIGLILLFGSYCWWKSFSPLHPYQRFHVHFHDVAGMNPQAAVYVNGVRVGSVEQIAVLDRSTVEVGVRINTTKIRIPQGSEFVILPNGVVGAKYVEILLPPPSSKPTYLTEKSISWGEDPVRPEIVVNELAEKLSNIDFQVVQDKLARGMDSMNYAAQRISTLSRKLEPAAEKLGPAVEKLGPAAAGATVAEENVTALAKDLREPVQQMHQIMDQRHPLLHMIFGRPGHVKKQEKMKTTTTTAGDGTGLEKKSRIEVQTKDDNVPRASDAEVVSEKHQKHKKHHRNEADE